jgi:hypothetical protein
MTAVNGPETITLDRSGLPPLQFTGSLVAHATGQFVNTEPDKPNNDWWEIAIYRAESDRPYSAPRFKYVVAVTYHNARRNGFTQRFADATQSPAALLAKYDPLAVLVNFPPGPQFAARQAHLVRMVRSQWQAILSAVLREFPEVV